MLERFLIDQGKNFSVITNSVREAYRRRYASVRAVGLSGFAVASFVVPTLLAMQQATILSPTDALRLSAYVIVPASLEFLICLIIMIILWIRFSSIGTALTKMELAWTYLTSAFRTEVVGLTALEIRNPLDSATQNQLISDFHNFHSIFDPAMRAWLIRVSRGYLDKDLKKRYQDHIDFMADHQLSHWSVMERQSRRVLSLLDGNPEIKREVEIYAAYKPPSKESLRVSNRGPVWPMDTHRQYRFSFLVGLVSAMIIVDPLYPVWLRVALVPAVLFAGSMLIVGTWFRYFERNPTTFAKLEPIISGIGAGASTVVLILTFLAYYFHLPISIPFVG